MTKIACQSVLLACLLLAGCHESAGLSDGQPLSMNDRERQYKSKLLVLTDGHTNRAEVLSVMGDPDRVSDDKRTIMFYWTVKNRESDLLSRSFIITQFDKNDVLVRHSAMSYEARFGGPKLPEEALSEFLNPPSVK